MHPFAVILADDLIDGEPPALQQMVDIFQERQCSVIAVQTDAARGDSNIRHDPQQPDRRGGCTASRASSRSRKPKDAPTNLAVVGRYILTPYIFHFLDRIGKGTGGEIQLTDGIARCSTTSRRSPGSSTAPATTAARSWAT